MLIRVEPLPTKGASVAQWIANLQGPLYREFEPRHRRLGLREGLKARDHRVVDWPSWDQVPVEGKRSLQVLDEYSSNYATYFPDDIAEGRD
ncbi:hypothetical protein PoB_007227100 [Plakobranchus ocellatus]|uniref:Uncharacterized protein n=1 Tax=Plakobranchus ocellatus TaxID=259542 RepID=A0AAV4DPG5_9GAST|nr:hypothetical protein PoB_007227100 [Plakobranchus ocellatus]